MWQYKDTMRLFIMNMLQLVRKKTQGATMIFYRMLFIRKGCNCMCLVGGKCAMMMHLSAQQPSLVRHSTFQVQQPPYPPVLAPYNFFLFQKAMSRLEGRRFQGMKRIRENLTRQQLIISENEFQECSKQWKQHWIKCVASEEDSFEGDQMLNW